MFLRLVFESVRRRVKSRAATLVSVALGAGAASGLAMILIGIGDRISEEFRSRDANIVIEPGAEPLLESDAGRLRSSMNRWANQLRWILPVLEVERSGYVFLGREPDPRWSIEGKPGVLAGISLGLTPGTTLGQSPPLVVTGIVSTGGEEDAQIIVPLRTAQEIAGTPGRVSRFLVSAVVTPESDEFRRFILKEPGPGERKLSAARLEKLQCTPFPTVVAREYAGVLDAKARVLRRVAETEGAVLHRVERVVGILAAAAIVAACLSVLGTTMASVVDRRKEVGLMKALGATNAAVAAIFLGEGLLLAVPGSVLGYLIGLASAKSMSLALFGTAVPGSAGVYLVTLATALVIVAIGVAWPLRRAVGLEPHRVLHEV